PDLGDAPQAAVARVQIDHGLLPLGGAVGDDLVDVQQVLGVLVQDVVGGVHPVHVGRVTAGHIQGQARPVVAPGDQVDLDLPAVLLGEGLERLLVGRDCVLVPQAEGQRALAASVRAPGPTGTTVVARRRAGRDRADDARGGHGGEDGTTV